MRNSRIDYNTNSMACEWIRRYSLSNWHPFSCGLRSVCCNCDFCFSLLAEANTFTWSSQKKNILLLRCKARTCNVLGFGRPRLPFIRSIVCVHWALYCSVACLLLSVLSSTEKKQKKRIILCPLFENENYQQTPTNSFYCCNTHER